MFATTTEAEIVEKRLKLNAERTIKQNKAATAILKDCLFQKKMDRVLIWRNYLTVSPKLQYTFKIFFVKKSYLLQHNSVLIFIL
jgi:hypothetical protein